MEENSEQLKGILVGCGFMGGMHAQIYTQLADVAIVAAVDRRIAESEEKLSKLGCPAPVYATLSEALGAVDCDFVDVCLPTHLHRDAAIEVIEAGKNLFCEKPLARSVEEADDILEAAARRGTLAQVGQCLRFWPEYMRLMEYQKSGEGGRLLSLNLVRRAARPTFGVDDWFSDEAQSGGAALDLHIHDTDIVVALLGQPNKVTSRVTRDDSGPAHIFSVMDYDGLTVVNEGGWNYPAKWGFQMAYQAVYEKAVLDYDSSNDKGLMICEGESEPRALDVQKIDAGQSQSGEGNVSDLGGYWNELKYYTDCLKAGKAPEIATLQDARDSLALTLKEIELGDRA